MLVIQFRRDYSKMNKIANVDQWMIYFLRVYSCKLGCNPQKYTFLENGDRTAHSACTHTPVIYIKVVIYTTQENVWLKSSIIQTEQQMFMALDIDSRSGLHDFTLFAIKHNKK